MNVKSRIALRAAIDKATEALEEIRTIGEEEREKFDNMSEGLQQTERGISMNEGADAMEDVAGTIEAALENIEEYASWDS